ncbi:NAD(P)H-dependent oxidoreductase [Devosia psychrophila]|uniref:NAD(P)H dehydrogenase n=1 Tax=Devosia psychrophila TaxID=728005 RepID=A0A0F5PTD2_9HYPH|nr:NAD(P)H-dependent oxidoreductase [Devosia psychrophila]KKC31967.1 NAD(P)H dehydrogenase [Devosia psychrophila]SFC74353.1 Putative NADPH-quinone reductase (modulator of drug activity B) [Devosia psychrophila]
MRVHVIHAHPVETSFNRALFDAVVDELTRKGHEVDALNLYDAGFDAVLSREERLNYHDVPGNLTPLVKPYVDRLVAAEALVFVHPVWNYGYPAILKGYFDRIFLPGVSFVLEGGVDRGRLVPNFKNIKKVAFVTTYGGNRWRTMVMGDPPRRLARRWAWVTFGTRNPPKYLALYDLNNCTPDGLLQFLARVRRAMSDF